MSPLPSSISTRCRSRSNVGSSGASRASSERSTKITSSSAWLTMYVSCSGNSRMFSVCRTRPVHGAAKYSSRWRAVFQANVATRPSSEMPSVSSTPPRRRVRVGPVAVRDALAAGRRRGDDLLVPEVLLRPVEQVGDRERNVLHQALHGCRNYCSPARSANEVTAGSETSATDVTAGTRRRRPTHASRHR